MSEDIESCIISSACQAPPPPPGAPPPPGGGLSLRERALLEFQLASKNGSANGSVLTLTDAVMTGSIDFDAYLALQCAPGYEGECLRKRRYVCPGITCAG